MCIVTEMPTMGNPGSALDMILKYVPNQSVNGCVKFRGSSALSFPCDVVGISRLVVEKIVPGSLTNKCVPVLAVILYPKSTWEGEWEPTSQCVIMCFHCFTIFIALPSLQ